MKIICLIALITLKLLKKCANMQMAWAWNHPEAPLYAHIIVNVSCFILAIGVAYAFSRLYDIPVREWLTERWLKGVKHQK